MFSSCSLLSYFAICACVLHIEYTIIELNCYSNQEYLLGQNGLYKVPVLTASAVCIRTSFGSKPCLVMNHSIPMLHSSPRATFQSIVCRVSSLWPTIYFSLLEVLSYMRLVVCMVYVTNKNSKSSRITEDDQKYTRVVFVDMAFVYYCHGWLSLETLLLIKL